MKIRRGLPQPVRVQTLEQRIHHSDMPKILSRTNALIFGLLLATGCSETISPDTASPDDDDDEVALAGEPANDRPLTVTDVALDAAVADLCSVRSAFEFDPTREDDTAKTQLSALASCVTSGPLQGRSIELIAHTSAHRDSAYARRRGESRAESLRALLIENGVPQDGVRSSAAVAGDERSVEVRIAPRHAH